MRKMILMALLVTFSLSLQASEKKGVDSLSPELRTLLTKEMKALEIGMKDIFSNTISGNYDSVSKTAMKIKNSFILKQKLTKSMKKELHTKLPKEFVTIDQGFHVNAGKLSEAAELEDVELMNFYVSKMTNTCVKCHSTFAKSRFSSFK